MDTIILQRGLLPLARVLRQLVGNANYLKWVVFLVIGSLLSTLPSASAATPDAKLTDGWLRLLLPSRPAAGYFTLSNFGATSLVLVGAEIKGCSSVMLHRSTNSGGSEAMGMVSSVSISSHGTIRFAPGGYHLMCMGPDPQVLRIGGMTTAILHFADGGHLSASFQVRGARP
ncbi:copper chaperone PCu(A)C [Acidisoma sp. L85]|uniref:copper chaperone PCu(A)C n=1 Tax=Acidisoma sp. L85 TaxID=1641850 RepID=UPI00352BCF2B